MKSLLQIFSCCILLIPVVTKGQSIGGADAVYRTANPLETSKYVRVKAPGTASLIDLNYAPVVSWNEPFEPTDTNKIYSITPVSWTEGKSLPVLRMRHPLNTFESAETNNISLNSDFKILPYQFGWAMEYNGVVECWVGEWSIHRGNAYKDVEGKGNGWGAVSWVGDDLDQGGVRMTARNNPAQQINYGELSVEKFDGTPNGNMHFRLPGVSNEYKWTWGARGDSNTAMVLSPQKLTVYKKIETTALDALTVKADTLNIGVEGNPGIQLKSYMDNLPANSTVAHFGWLQYNKAGYTNLAGSTAYLTRSDIAADHIFFTGAGTPKASMVLKGSGNLSVGTYADDFRLNVASDNAITAKFSGRVIGANAVENNEFITLSQLRDSLSKIKFKSIALDSRSSVTAGKSRVTETSPEAGMDNETFKPGEETQYGNFTFSSDGKTSSIEIPHGQSIPPVWWNVIATSKDAGQISYVTVDETNIIVHYREPPPAGSNNVSFNFSFRQSTVNDVKYL
jgi:hypothetical protein